MATRSTHRASVARTARSGRIGQDVADAARAWIAQNRTQLRNLHILTASVQVNPADPVQPVSAAFTAAPGSAPAPRHLADDLATAITPRQRQNWGASIGVQVFTLSI